MICTIIIIVVVWALGGEKYIYKNNQQSRQTMIMTTEPGINNEIIYAKHASETEKNTITVPIAAELVQFLRLRTHAAFIRHYLFDSVEYSTYYACT